MSIEKSQRAEDASGLARLFWGESSGSSLSLCASHSTISWILGRIAVALLAFLVVGNSPWGQATTSVRGTELDPPGKPIARATVALANFESKTNQTTPPQ